MYDGGREIRCVLLRASDQRTVVLLLCVAAVLAGCWLLRRGSAAHVDLDRTPALPAAVYRLEINDAPWTEFALMPGIGETLGRHIVAYRRQHGPFRSADELTAVPGIGPVKLAAMRPWIRREVMVP